MITGIGIGIGFGGARLSAEARKARSIPVPGAVVIAPFESSVTNYGSVAGAFALVGDAHIGSAGLVLDGTGDVAYLVTGSQSSFTCAFRARMSSIEVSGSAVVIDGGTPVTESSTGISLSSNAPTHKWVLDRAYVKSTISSVDHDTNWHTWTIRRSGTANQLYLDGVLIANDTGGVVTGTGLIIGGLYVAGSHSFANLQALEITNLCLFASALSDTDRALVEAWAVT